ncbi:hypothetical protein LTS08_004414 [Lithohypha guttulata]|nr:hypothetical protein LTS08_004414 [Lithohypha guttulata]
MVSQKSSSWTALFTFLTFADFLILTLAQAPTSNTTTTTTTAVPYSAFFDSEVYPDGAGVDLTKGLNNPTVVAVNVPEGPDQQDLFFHFSAPAERHSWVGFGLGDRMAGSLMFIIYRSENSTRNVTVSPRIGSGHSPPKFTADVGVNALELSGVDEKNRFVVNMQCTNCRQWDGGSVKITNGTKVAQPVFYALGPDVELESDDESAAIRQHEREPEMLDLFLVPGAAGVPIIEDDPSEPRRVSGGAGGTHESPGSGGKSPMVSLALHAFFMCFAFSLIFPGGYMLLRVFEKSFGHPHQILGFVVVFLVLAAWTLGLVGHRPYMKTQTPSPLIKVHRVVGPLAILLGFANACVGFAWAGMTRTIVVYAIFNLLVATVVGSLVFWKKRRAVRKAATNSHAASNFREGAQANFEHGPAVYVGGPPPGYNGQMDVPMHSIRPNK